MSVAEVQSDGLGVLATVVEQEAPQIGEGMALGLGVAKERSEALVQGMQFARSSTDVVGGHEQVLLTVKQSNHGETNRLACDGFLL